MNLIQLLVIIVVSIYVVSLVGENRIVVILINSLICFIVLSLLLLVNNFLC